MSVSLADLSMATKFENQEASNTMVGDLSFANADGVAAIEKSVSQTEDLDLQRVSSIIKTQLEGGERSDAEGGEVTARDQQTQEASIFGGKGLQIAGDEDDDPEEGGNYEGFSDDGYEAGSELEDDENDDYDGYYDDFENDDDGSNQGDLKISELIIPAPLAVVPRAQLSRLQDAYSAEDLKFHLFPYLAAELRLKIWQYCRLVPQTIHVNYEVKADEYGAAGWRICNSECGGAIRDVCQEARNEVAKVATWEVFKLDNYKYAIDKISSKATSLINLEIDTVYLNTNALLYVQASRAAHEARETIEGAKRQAFEAEEKNNFKDSRCDTETLHGAASMPWKKLFVNAPTRSPISAIFGRRIQHLAIDMSLWRDWYFEDTFQEGYNSCDLCHNPDIYYNKGDFITSVTSNLAVSRDLKTLTFVEGGEFVSLQENRIDFHQGWRQSSSETAGDLREPLVRAFSNINQKWTAEIKLATVV